MNVKEELLKSEVIVQSKISFNISRLEPGYYIVKDKTKELQFVKSAWNYGGANYITLAETWQGTGDRGHCEVKVNLSDQYAIKKLVEEMDYDSLEIRKV